MFLRSSSRLGVRSFSTVRSTLQERVQKYPTKDALRFFKQGVRWNLGQLQQHSEAVACGLLQLGLQQETHTVTSSLKASAENVSLFYAGAFTGIKVAQVDGGIESKESLFNILSATQCKVLVISQDEVPVVSAALGLEKSPHILDTTLSIDEFPSLKYVIHTGQELHRGMHRFKDVLVYYPTDSPIDDIAVKPDTTALTVVDASGSTVSELTHGDVMSKSSEAAAALSLTDNGKVVFAGKKVVPALPLGSLACIVSNSKMIVPAEAFSSEDLSQAKEIEGCDFAVGDSTPSGVPSWTP